MATDGAPSETDESTAETPERIRTRWDESDNPSTAIIEAVAATTDREPTAMSPLYDYIDPEALDAVLTSRTTSTNNAIVISFTYDDVSVQVDSGGWIEVQPDGTNHK